jgi:hypothetical protein
MSTAEWTVLWICIGYLILATWARWRFIAIPLRGQLLADLKDLTALKDRKCTGADMMSRCDAANAINHLLGISTTYYGGSERLIEAAASQIEEEPKHGLFRGLSRFSGVLGIWVSNPRTVEEMLRKPGLSGSSWSGKTEEEAIRRIAAAQAYVPDLLSAEEVKARLIVVRGWLTEYGEKPEYVALGRQIDVALNQVAVSNQMPPQPNTVLRRMTEFWERRRRHVDVLDTHNRALLGQALTQTYAMPGSPSEMIWHRKTGLVLVSGLAAIVLLSFAVNAELVILFGAVGGLLQRLWQLVYERDVKGSNPLYWSTLFLAPVAGALAAVGGLYLISLLKAMNILGSTIWQYIGFHGQKIGKLTAADIGIAFLLGFSAKLLGNLATRSETAATPTSAP